MDNILRVGSIYLSGLQGALHGGNCILNILIDSYNLAARKGTSISSADKPPCRPIRGFSLAAHHQ